MNNSQLTILDEEIKNIPLLDIGEPENSEAVYLEKLITLLENEILIQVNEERKNDSFELVLKNLQEVVNKFSREDSPELLKEKIKTLQEDYAQALTTIVNAADTLAILKQQLENVVSEEWITQIDDLLQEYLQKLKEMNIEIIDPLGERINGEFMMSIGRKQVEDSTVSSGTVIEVLKYGYKFLNNKKVISPAQVITAK